MPFTVKSPKTWFADAIAVIAVVALSSLTASSSEAGKGAPIAVSTPIAAILSTSPCASPISGPYTGMAGHEGRIARLYGAYFGRNPDAPGFEFWLQKLQAGEWTNESTSAFFANSDEFKARFGYLIGIAPRPY